jgi:beta-phosphoglucomutase-like phosphatase (HAD superfamily)
VKENNLKCFNYFTQILKIFPDTEFYILSGSKEIVIRQILNIWQLDNRFKKVISVFDLKISKKEVLINSQSYFETAKENIVLFEDLASTLKEAKELGVLAIGIKSKYNYKTLSNYDFVIDVTNE